ncbi:MAG: cupin domain-containing protein [Acidobacteriaceae bacterium]|jgi:quercetin dioxygenase-like cupin family protein
MSEQLAAAARGPVEEIGFAGIFLRFLIDGPTSEASLTMFEMSVEPGARVPVPHHHVGFDEMGYGLSGKLRMTLDGNTVDLGPGDSLYIPRGAVHGFENPFAETARSLVVITPGIFGAPFFREVASLLTAGGPPDPKALAAIMLRHGLVPAKPTPSPRAPSR